MREGADSSVRTLSAGGRQVNGIQGRKAEPHSGFGPLAACAGRARALLLLRSLWAGIVRDGSWSVGSCSVAPPPALTAAALRSNARVLPRPRGEHHHPQDPLRWRGLWGRGGGLWGVGESIRLRRGLTARAALDGGGSASPGCGGVGRGWPAGGAAGDGSGSIRKRSECRSRAAESFLHRRNKVAIRLTQLAHRPTDMHERLAPLLLGDQSRNCHYPEEAGRPAKTFSR